MKDDAGQSPDRRGDDLLKSVLKSLGVLDCFTTLDRKLSISEIARRT